MSFTEAEATGSGWRCSVGSWPLDPTRLVLGLLEFPCATVRPKYQDLPFAHFDSGHELAPTRADAFDLIDVPDNPPSLKSFPYHRSSPPVLRLRVVVPLRQPDQSPVETHRHSALHIMGTSTPGRHGPCAQSTPVGAISGQIPQ